MEKAIAYIRVSTEEQTDGHSLDNQLDQINMYCKLYNLELIDVIRDEGISGRKTSNRPGFNALMGMVENNIIQHVVALSFTRFSRNTMDLLKSIDTMTKHNVSFHSITERINTDGAIGKFLVTLFSGLSQFESDQIGERTRSVKKFCKENGRTYTFPMLGFDNKFEINANGDKVNGKLVPNEKELVAVKRVFELKEKYNFSYGQISKQMNIEEIPTKQNKKWHPITVSKMLNNNIYRQMNVL